MKKIALLLATAGLAVTFFSSCIEDSEVTGVLTDDKKDEIASDDPDKVFTADLAGMYTNLQQYVYQDVQHNYFGQKSFDYLTSLMGNDMVMTGRYGMSLNHYMLQYRGASYVPTYNRWYEYYTTIAAANDIMKAIDPEDTRPEVLKYKASALTFRGYAYLQLTMLYSYSYYVGADGTKWGKGTTYDHSQDLCVPINTETITGNQPRSTVAQVYEQLIGDLETAYNLFEECGMVKTASPTDMDGCVAANYLMRAFMVKHDWKNAAKYAKVIMDNFGVLDTEADITQGFSDINLKDVVFGCDINTNNSTIYMSWFSQMDAYGDGYAGIGVTRAGFGPFVDKISDTDIRLQWFCCDRSTGGLLRDTEDPVAADYQSVKFIGTGRPNIQAGIREGWELGDYIYLRSEEAYLTYAEALAHQGDPNAKTVLEEFMRTRDPQYVCRVSEKADLIEEINFQKRVEFWGEGMEYIDNRRLNIPVDRTDATWGSANNHFTAAKFYKDQEDIAFLYQLPNSEIENNPEIGPGNQNP